MKPTASAAVAESWPPAPSVDQAAVRVEAHARNAPKEFKQMFNWNPVYARRHFGNPDFSRHLGDVMDNAEAIELCNSARGYFAARVAQILEG